MIVALESDKYAALLRDSAKYADTKRELDQLKEQLTGLPAGVLEAFKGWAEGESKTGSTEWRFFPVGSVRVFEGFGRSEVRDAIRVLCRIADGGKA